MIMLENTQDELDKLVQYANRYLHLRNKDLYTIENCGVFAGLTPDNVVLNGDELDAVIDAEMSNTGLHYAVIDAEMSNNATL